MVLTTLGSSPFISYEPDRLTDVSDLGRLLDCGKCANFELVNLYIHILVLEQVRPIAHIPTDFLVDGVAALDTALGAKDCESLISAILDEEKPPPWNYKNSWVR